MESSRRRGYRRVPESTVGHSVCVIHCITVCFLKFLLEDAGAKFLMLLIKSVLLPVILKRAVDC